MIIIHIEDGMVQAVYSDKEKSYVLVDFDTEGEPEAFVNCGEARVDGTASCEEARELLDEAERVDRETGKGAET